MDDTLPNVLTEGDDGVYEAVGDTIHFDRLNALGASLQTKLDEDITWRAETGIEQEWQDADDAYQGHDDANQVRKPRTLDGPFTTAADRSAKTAPRSRVFLNITGPYVDAAAARIGDMILKGDDTNWAIRPTPLQDEELDIGMDAPQPPAGFLGSLSQGPAAPVPPMPQTPVASAVQTQAAPSSGNLATLPDLPGNAPGTDPAINMQSSQEGALPMGAQETQSAIPAPAAGPSVGPVVDQVKQLQAAAEASAALATKQIEDWLIECQYHAEMRKVLEDAARLGTGVLKGPFPVSRSGKRVTKGPMGVMLEKFTKIAPASRRISLWDLFPAAGCGEDIQNGSHIWERDSISARKLRSFMDDDGLGYIPEQIQKVLDGDPDKGDKKVATTGNERQETFNKNNYEIWYFTGMLERDDLVAAGLPDSDLPSGAVQVPALVTMIDGVVIKAALNPLDDGEFPYDVLPWKRRTGLPWGRGVGWQMLTPQRMINASARTMMENLGLASGPQIALNRGIIRPADGIWEMTPRKLWYMVADPKDPTPHKITDAISFFMPPSITNEFMTVIQMAQKLAEDVTGLPQLMQGSQGAAPDTVGGMTILNNNASTVLRRIARQVDDKVTEPHIRRYYTWLVEYGEDDKAKGDFQIDARGSTALVDREMSKQVIMQMLPMSLNPAYGASPPRVFEEAVKANDMDPKRFQLTQDEKDKLAQQPPPVPEAVQVAKVNADSRVAIAQAANKTTMDRAGMETAAEKYLAEKDMDQRWQIALMNYATQRQISLSDAKTQLFLGVSKLNTQAALSAHAAAGKSVPQVSTPPTEPAGQAAPGMAYQE